MEEKSIINDKGSSFGHALKSHLKNLRNLVLCGFDRYFYSEKAH